MTAAGDKDSVMVKDILEKYADSNDDVQERYIRRLPCWNTIKARYLQKDRKVEYVYTVAENGRPVERMTVEYEKEANELELKMTIERGNVREELVFEDETEDGVRVIAVSGTLDGEPVAFRIYIRDGHYDYVFSDGGTVSGDRWDDDDDWFDGRFDDDDD